MKPSPPFGPEPSTQEIGRWEPWTAISAIMRTSTPRVALDCSRETLAAHFQGCDDAEALVIDATGRPVGIVARDSLRHPGATAGALMSPAPFALNEAIPISLAAGLMASAGINQVPVVSWTTGAVGLLTCREILTWIARQAGHRVLDVESAVRSEPKEDE